MTQSSVIAQTTIDDYTLRQAIRHEIENYGLFALQDLVLRIDGQIGLQDFVDFLREDEEIGNRFIAFKAAKRITEGANND